MKKFSKLSHERVIQSTRGIKNCNNIINRMEYKWRQKNWSAWHDITERHGVKKKKAAYK